MNSKMTPNSQLSRIELKQKQKQTKQTTRIGTESQKWKSHGGLSSEMGRKENGAKGIDNKKCKCRFKIDMGRLRIG